MFARSFRFNFVEARRNAASVSLCSSSASASNIVASEYFSNSVSNVVSVECVVRYERRSEGSEGERLLQ